MVDPVGTIFFSATVLNECPRLGTRRSQDPSRRPSCIPKRHKRPTTCFAESHSAWVDIDMSEVHGRVWGQNYLLASHTRAWSQDVYSTGWRDFAFDVFCVNCVAHSTPSRCMHVCMWPRCGVSVLWSVSCPCLRSFSVVWRCSVHTVSDGG